MWQSDALAAMKRSNNVQLDGKCKRLEVVRLNTVTTNDKGHIGKFH